MKAPLFHLGLGIHYNFNIGFYFLLQLKKGPSLPGPFTLVIDFDLTIYLFSSARPCLSKFSLIESTDLPSFFAIFLTSSSTNLAIMLPGRLKPSLPIALMMQYESISTAQDFHLFMSIMLPLFYQSHDRVQILINQPFCLGLIHHCTLYPIVQCTHL